MKFTEPAGPNPLDRANVIGQPHPRIEGPLKVTGTAPYSYEYHDVAPDAAYGFVLGSAIAKGRIASIDTRDALSAPGVLTVLTADNAGMQQPARAHAAQPLAGPDIQHYHQAIALVVAETFEQACAAAGLIRVDYDRSDGDFSLARKRDGTQVPQRNPEKRVGNFETAFEAAAVKVDQTYRTPDQSHMMMEPHATIARWDEGAVTVWTAAQLVGIARRSLAGRIGVAEDKVHIIASYVGGGFGGKGTPGADAVLAALAARKLGRAVKVTLTRPIMPNNTTHRAATIQRVRLGAARDGRISAIAHESWSGNLPGGGPEGATAQTELLYAGANRLLRTHLATLDLPEGGAMRAPGEATGMMALEIAMDELAEKLQLDPVELRIRNDTQVVPADPDATAVPFSTRPFVECLRQGAERFGWSKRNRKPGALRDGQWLIGHGMASAIRGAPIMAGGARVILDTDGKIIVETNMTDIGTGSYTMVGQTAAELMGVPLDAVTVRLADSGFPDAWGGGGQAGAATVTSGVYAACTQLRDKVAQALGVNSADAEFVNGEVLSGSRRAKLADAAPNGPIIAEDRMEYGDLSRRFEQQTFGAHFCELAVHALTGEVRIRRMLAVCAGGRILNPLTARSQVIGGMTMGIGAALTEELAVDERFGFFVNHDLAGYEVPVHADVPHLDAHFIDEVDSTMSPVKAKGVGELGISGVAPAIANAIYNATGVRVRDYPITLDKYFERLPAIV